MVEADRLNVFITEGKVWLSIQEGADILAQPGLDPDEAIEVAADLLDCALCLKRKAATEVEAA
jgi:hypothetical protein